MWLDRQFGNCELVMGIFRYAQKYLNNDSFFVFTQEFYALKVNIRVHPVSALIIQKFGRSKLKNRFCANFSTSKSDAGSRVVASGDELLQLRGFLAILRPSPAPAPWPQRRSTGGAP